MKKWKRQNLYLFERVDIDYSQSSQNEDKIQISCAKKCLTNNIFKYKEDSKKLRNLKGSNWEQEDNSAGTCQWDWETSDGEWVW